MKQRQIDSVQDSKPPPRHPRLVCTPEKHESCKRRHVEQPTKISLVASPVRLRECVRRNGGHLEISSLRKSASD